MKQIYFVLVLVLLLPIFSTANVPAPFFSGYAGIEPSGFENLTVLSEKITIDLLNLGTYKNFGDNNSVNLEMTFEVEIKEAEKPLELIFPTIKSAKFFVDDAEFPPIVGKPEKQLSIGWQLPKKTLWLENKQLDYNAINRVDCYECSVYKFQIPSGKHKIKITQELTPSSNVTGALTKYWQFSFVFLPAERRANIAKTEIEIKTPENWQTFISPDIQSESVWQKSFDKVTENSVTITTKMPVPASYKNVQDFSDYIFWFVLVIFPLICFVLCWFLLAHSKFWWLWGILFTISWSSLAVIAIYISEFTPVSYIPEAQQLNYGYGEIGSIIAMIVFGSAAFIAGFPFWFCVWLLARNFRKPKV